MYFFILMVCSLFSASSVEAMNSNLKSRIEQTFKKARKDLEWSKYVPATITFDEFFQEFERQINNGNKNMPKINLEDQYAVHVFLTHTRNAIIRKLERARAFFSSIQSVLSMLEWEEINEESKEKAFSVEEAEHIKSILLNASELCSQVTDVLHFMDRDITNFMGHLEGIPEEIISRIQQICISYQKDSDCPPSFEIIKYRQKGKDFRVIKFVKCAKKVVETFLKEFLKPSHFSDTKERSVCITIGSNKPLKLSWNQYVSECGKIRQKFLPVFTNNYENFMQRLHVLLPHQNDLEAKKTLKDHLINWFRSQEDAVRNELFLLIQRIVQSYEDGEKEPPAIPEIRIEVVDIQPPERKIETPPTPFVPVKLPSSAQESEEYWSHMGKEGDEILMEPRDFGDSSANTSVSDAEQNESDYNNNPEFGE